MRVLLDECVPARLKQAFPGHAAQTVSESGWRSSKDKPLLTFAQERFDVFVTVDRKLEKQNDLSRFRLGFIIARVHNNRLDGFKPIFHELKSAVERIRAGEVIYIISPRMRT